MSHRRRPGSGGCGVALRGVAGRPRVGGVRSVEEHLEAVLAGVAHRQLRQPIETVAGKRLACIILERPGVILTGPQVELGKRLGGIRSEHGVAQLAVVVAIEKQPEGMLGVVARSAEAAANAQAGIDLKTFGAVRVD